MKFVSFFFAVFLLSLSLQAQNIGQLKNRLNGANSSSGKNGGDSLTHRDPNSDSITISYRFFDSTRIRKIDSSINDWYTRFPVPASYDYMGNFGAAAHPLIFTPNMKPGFDAGFHSFDIYKFNLTGTRFYTTTRPYTELAYVIGSSAEQMANLMHTQNRKNNLNFTFEYRFIASPGAFKNQNTSHNNFRVSTFYQSKNKRYGLYFIYINNKLNASENGGLQNTEELKDFSLSGPTEAATRLGNNVSSSYGGNIFNSKVAIGNYYRESLVYFRHYFDFGQKDSIIVNDSTTTRLFYPRLRLQHSISYGSNIYEYHDTQLDSTNYRNFFKFYGADSRDSIRFRDNWKDITNEFSIITFPDKKNVAQFLRLSADLQILKGTFNDSITRDYTNIYASAEYRNRTRNGKWDLEALGQLYLTGSFIGDYTAYVSLQRELGKKLGTLQVGFQNTNKSPTQLTQGYTSFPVVATSSFNNTNLSRLFATVYLPIISARLYGNYYAITNYTYFTDYYTTRQSSLFNYLNAGFEKKIKLSKHINWYTEAAFQQALGNAPVHLPQVYTRNRLAFEGNFFKNLFLSLGLEIRYFTPYKADGYNPLNGQFYYQEDSTISNRPDINVYMNFRIKSFKAFVRLENLNTLDKYGNNVGFLNHNYSAPYYPQNALWLRIGIWWNFVN